MKKRITALILSAMLLSMVSAAAAGAESDVYKQTEMQFTGINTTRAENTLIIYRGKPSTGTNTWGYEVVCDKEGTVISVGGNNNDIPEGGFVLSAIGTYKQPLINAAEVGMTVTLFESEKKFYIGYSPSGIKRKYELMISEINHGRNHRLVMTTHSPYILYAINNCLLASLVKDKMDEDLASSVSCVKYAVSPADVSVWSIKDGCVRNDKGEPHHTIQDDRGLIRKNYFNDVMKDVMGDFNTLLSFLD